MASFSERKHRMFVSLTSPTVVLRDISGCEASSDRLKKSQNIPSTSILPGRARIVFSAWKSYALSSCHLIVLLIPNFLPLYNLSHALLQKARTTLPIQNLTCFGPYYSTLLQSTMNVLSSSRYHHHLPMQGYPVTEEFSSTAAFSCFLQRLPLHKNVKKFMSNKAIVRFSLFNRIKEDSLAAQRPLA
ncbi:hypothetical protein TNCV_3041751 [Trichonephila clavipes]|nr:hypothetical protein TNCV_3041751 [Trichonephila clavipes]